MATPAGNNTRDIAIEARQSASSAHHRLDDVDDQIRGFTRALSDPETGLIVKIADLTATVRAALKVMGAFCGLGFAVAAGLIVVALTHG